MTKEFPYSNCQFDFIYARLILHYLLPDDLDRVLVHFYKMLKENGDLFIVVPSTKNVISKTKIENTDPVTNVTKVPYYNNSGEIVEWSFRYYQTPNRISEHLSKSGFTIVNIQEYDELLYADFMRTKPTRINHLIEVLAKK